MRAWIAGVAITVSICLLASGAMAQAAAEGALTHALSSGMGSSLGNAMGKATNQMAGRVAQQTSHAASRQAATARVKHPGTTTTVVPNTSASAPSGLPASGAPSNGSMIVSIQGGVRQQSACATPANNAAVTATASGDAPSSTAAVPVQGGDCNKTADPAAFAHPSEITLQMPK